MSSSQNSPTDVPDFLNSSIKKLKEMAALSNHDSLIDLWKN